MHSSSRAELWHEICAALHGRLGIPDTEYAATIKMPSSEFARICK